MILSISIFSQDKHLSFTSNTKREPVDTFTCESLSQKLTASCNTEAEKVRAIFRWITENISYNVRPSYNSSQALNPYSGDINDTGELKSLTERVADGVLKKKVAFCDGYARLFKTLCNYAGIKAEVITGYARTNINRIDRKFRSNHRWNAVLIDNNWRLLDATWASGYVNYSSEFTQSYNEYYYLTPPEDFIRDHYPEDLTWTLLPSPPVLKEFQYTPFKKQAKNCLE